MYLKSMNIRSAIILRYFSRCKLLQLDMFGIQMETVLDDLDDYYEEIYRIESENEGNVGLDEFV